MPAVPPVPPVPSLRRLVRGGALAGTLVLIATTAAVASAERSAATQPFAGAAAAQPVAERAAADWDPPADLVQPLDEVWQHVESTYPDLYGFRNYGWDQVVANGGSLNFCVRWESDQPVSAELRDSVHTALEQQSAQWFEAIRGFDGFPYDQVPVKVVGWAVENRDTLQWNDDSVDVYAGDLDSEGAPKCGDTCSRFHHQDGDYSQCPGGADRHFDQSLWLTEGFQGGAGGDWGQRVGREYFVGALGQEHIHIWLHEMGHTFGLDDFYDWTPTGVDSFLMKAGSAQQITEFDQWMFRDFWRHLKSRYGL